MVAFSDYPANHPSSHYEYQIRENYSKQKKVKEQAYKLMETLDGWCPRTKAMVLMDLIFNHQPDVVVEVGIWGGKSFIPMALALKATGKGIIYGIDPWKSSDSIVGFDDANKEWWGKVDHEKVMNHFLRKIREFGLTQNSRILRTTSADAESISNIDLIHIDGNHSEDSALFDVMKWVPLVKSGGFILFDDVDWSTTKKATRWLDEHCYRITTFQGDNVWGIWMKK